MEQTVRQWCEQWLIDLPGWEDFAPRGRGVTPTLCARKVLHARIKRDRPDVQLTNKLSAEAARPILALLDDESETIRDLLAMLRVAVDETMTIARRARYDVSFTQVAESFAGALGRSYQGGQVPSHEQLDSHRDRYLASRVPLGKRMGREAFESYAEHYHRAWAETGLANLETEPYSSVDLGDDEQPPLIGKHENTFDGLNRSVYARYDKAAQDPNVGGIADEIARREIARACARLGLEQPSAHVLLRSLHTGLIFGATPEPPDLRDAAHRQPPMAHDEPLEADPNPEPTLNLHCRINTQLMVKSLALLVTFVKREDQGWFLMRTSRMDEAIHDAMCRAWVEAHKRDRVGAPVTGGEAMGIVSLAVMKGIVSGQDTRRRLRDRPRRSSATTATPMQRARQWLAADEQRARRVLAWEEAAVAEYRQAAITHGLPPLDEVVASNT